MFGKLLGRRRKTREAGDQWHRWILNRARDPEPYRLGFIPDTLDGRFHMVTLVSTLVLRKLRTFGDDGNGVADAAYRAVFSGIDHALREEGVGDASIARRMRKLGEEFFGLARRVDAGFSEEDTHAELVAALVQNGISSSTHAPKLVDWLLATNESLEKEIDPESLLPR